MPIARTSSFLAGVSIPGSGLVLVLGMVLILAAGCTSTTPRHAPAIAQSVRPPASGPLEVLLMPPDIECRELTATGLAEPKADWTAAARRNVEQALGDLFAARRAELRTYDASELSPEQRQRVDQIMKLHDAVVRSIVTADALPTKRDRFEWSLGPGVRSLKEEFGTDYALFVIVRDSYASGGRKVMMAFSLLSALAGTFVPVEGGMLLGAASLVDLETGDVVWFNQVASETGDLRAEEPAADAVQDLMTGCPL